MTPRRMAELQAKAVEIIAQEARHLADCADYDEVARDDEEDEYLRSELRRQADTIATPRRPVKSLLDWGPDGLYDDTRAVHLHGRCHAASDGDCSWRECPQLKKYRSHCPLDKAKDSHDQ